ncbi:MAG: Chromate reductase, partial [uncultured Gemmatimonadetes bacterium]
TDERRTSARAAGPGVRGKPPRRVVQPRAAARRGGGSARRDARRDPRPRRHPAVQRRRGGAGRSAGRGRVQGGHPRRGRHPDRVPRIQPRRPGSAQERHRLGFAPAARIGAGREAGRRHRRQPGDDRLRAGADAAPPGVHLHQHLRPAAARGAGGAGAREVRRRGTPDGRRLAQVPARLHVHVPRLAPARGAL